jgi:hypothetical protein
LRTSYSLGWGDEFSLALIPASPESLTLPDNQASPPLGAGVVLMLEARDRARAEATLNRLDQVMATRYGFQVEPTKLGINLWLVGSHPTGE